MRGRDTGPVPPSPNAHAYEATVPSVSALAVASTTTSRCDGAVVNDAVGALLATTVTEVEAMELAPESSVTVRVTG